MAVKSDPKSLIRHAFESGWTLSRAVCFAARNGECGLNRCNMHLEGPRCVSDTGPTQLCATERCVPSRK
jgi:hypothetical protein